jgi:hypothetical protein
MELRLQQFIDSVEVLADIRNLDTFNPIVFQIEHPVTATRFTIVGSKVEPSYLGIPINTTWVVLDPQSPYFRMALKLVDVNNPDQSTTLPVVTDSEGVLSFYWNIIRTYDEIFSVPQYYSNAGKGPKGDKGDDGADGVVDYNLAMAALTALTGTLAITGPTTLGQGETQQYGLLLSEPQVLADGTITPPQDRQVVAPIFLVGQVPAGTFIDPDGTLHVGNLAADTTVTLQASYPSWMKPALATLSIALTKGVVSVTGIAITGATSANSGTTVQYGIDVTWSDGTVTHPTVTWALDSTNFGTISASGLLTIPSTIASSGSVNVSGSVTIDGIDYLPNVTVIVTKQQVAATVVSTAVTGSTAVNSGSTAQYTAVVNWSDGSTTNPTVVWSINTTVFGTLSTTGLLNVPSTISSSGSPVVKATFSIDGTTYQPTLTVAVTKLVVIPTVTDVTITGSSSVINGSNTTYAIQASWSNGTTTNPAASSWSTDVSTYGTISASGVLAVPADLAAGGNVTVNASVTVDGTVYTPTKVVAVSVVVVTVGKPRWGTGTAVQANWATFIKSMPEVAALTADGKYQMSIAVIGQTTFQYVAYPQSHGEATFYDKLSQFFGGFGGAGNNTQGPSAATISNYKDMPVVIDVDGVPYYLYRSDFANLGAAAGNQWEVTLTTP